jgi:hypothetical protein
MEEKELYPLLLEKLSKDYSLEKKSLPVESGLEIIHEHFKKKVIELMTRDYNRFINSLYRIDVDEKKVHEIMMLKDKTLIPQKLADLIIERQLARIKTQMLYKEGKL